MYVHLYTCMRDTTIKESKGHEFEREKRCTGTFEVGRGKEQECIHVIILKFKKII